MSQSNDISNASRYRKLLKQCAEGVCLWYPDEVGTVGDCGYVYEGSFNKLFSIFDAPDGLPSVPTPNNISMHSRNRNNNQLAWLSAVSAGCSLHANAPVSPDIVSLGFQLSAQHTDAAFLVPGGTSRTVDKYFEVNRLVNYLAENYKTIRDMFPLHPWNDCSLMILRGTTRASGWCRGLARRTAHAVHGTVSINLTGVPVFAVGFERQHGLVNPWIIESGPAASAASTLPRHTIIIQPVLARKREQYKHRLGSLFTTPTSAGTSEEMDFASPKGEAGTSPTRSFARSSAPSASLSTSDSLDGMTDFASIDTSSMITEADPLDDLELLLDAALEEYPELDVIIGTWDPIFAYIERYGQDPTVGEVRLEVEYQQGMGYRAGYLQAIHPNILPTPLFNQPRAKVLLKPCAHASSITTRPVVTLSFLDGVKPSRTLPRSGSDALSLRTESKSIFREEVHFKSPAPVQDLKGATEKLRRYENILPASSSIVSKLVNTSRDVTDAITSSCERAELWTLPPVVTAHIEAVVAAIEECVVFMDARRGEPILKRLLQLSSTRTRLAGFHTSLEELKQMMQITRDGSNLMLRSEAPARAKQLKSLGGLLHRRDDYDGLLSGLRAISSMVGRRTWPWSAIPVALSELVVQIDDALGQPTRMRRLVSEVGRRVELLVLILRSGGPTDYDDLRGSVEALLCDVYRVMVRIQLLRATQHRQVLENGDGLDVLISEETDRMHHARDELERIAHWEDGPPMYSP